MPRLLPFALIALAGCGPAGPKTYPVQGRIDGPAPPGWHVEAALESDPTVRASGVIDADGRFALETLHQGRVLRGAPGGRSLVRLVRDDEARRGRGVARRYLDWKSSGFALRVPPEGEVVFRVQSK